MATATVSPLKMVREFFGMTMPEMKVELVPMSDKDKAEIVQGLTDGSLNY